MDEKKENALVPRPSGAVEKAVPGVKRILSGMVSDTLALASTEQGSLAQTKFRIGDYEWCEPDYRQILIWAEETGLKPKEVIDRLLDQQSLSEGWSFPRSPSPIFKKPLFADGRLLKVNWDFQLLPRGNLNWAKSLNWVNGLEITCLRFVGALHEACLNDLGLLPLPRLVWLGCREIGLNYLNLTRVPQLEYLECSENWIEELQLDSAPKLTRLNCSDNMIAKLKYGQLPNLRFLDCSKNLLGWLDISNLGRLKYLSCMYNELNELKLTGLSSMEVLWFKNNSLREVDLTEIPKLVSLDCSNNHISNLDLTNSPKLRTLKCFRNHLTSLDLSSVQKLKSLDCVDNAISELDLSSCPDLVDLDCSGNPIPVLDIRGLGHLHELRHSPHSKVIMRPEQEHTVRNLLKPGFEHESEAYSMTPAHQLNMGLAYLYGRRGLPKHPIAAYRHLKFAAELGEKRAAEELTALVSTFSAVYLQEGERQYRKFKTHYWDPNQR